MRLAQAGLRIVHDYRSIHRFRARHTGVCHCCVGFSCTTHPFIGTDIARNRQLHEQQTHQCKKHCDEAVAAKKNHI